MITLDKPELKPYPVTDISFPISLLGESERLPYRSYVDNFDTPFPVKTRPSKNRL